MYWPHYAAWIYFNSVDLPSMAFLYVGLLLLGLELSGLLHFRIGKAFPFLFLFTFCYCYLNQSFVCLWSLRSLSCTAWACSHMHACALLQAMCCDRMIPHNRDTAGQRQQSHPVSTLVFDNPALDFDSSNDSAFDFDIMLKQPMRSLASVFVAMDYKPHPPKLKEWPWLPLCTVTFPEYCLK